MYDALPLTLLFAIIIGGLLLLMLGLRMTRLTHRAERAQESIIKKMTEERIGQ